MTLTVSPSPTTTISRSRLLASAPMMSSRGLAVVLLFDVAERDMHCVSDIVAGDAVFFVVLRCAITDLSSVKISLRSWLRQGWWCWRPVVAAAIRRRVVSCEFAQNPTAVRDGMDLTQTRAEPWVDREMVAGADQ